MWCPVCPSHPTFHRVQRQNPVKIPITRNETRTHFFNFRLWLIFLVVPSVSLKKCKRCPTDEPRWNLPCVEDLATVREHCPINFIKIEYRRFYNISKIILSIISMYWILKYTSDYPHKRHLTYSILFNFIQSQSKIYWMSFFNFFCNFYNMMFHFLIIKHCKL